MLQVYDLVVINSTIKSSKISFQININRNETKIILFLKLKQ